MKNRRIFFVGCLMFLGIVAVWLFPMSQVQAAGRFIFSEQTYRVAKTTLLFQRLCSEILPATPLGRHYLDLGYTHAPRLVRLLWYDETMAQQTWHVIDLYSPVIEALLNHKEETVPITQEMVDELLIFLSGMENRADNDLKQIFQDERSKVPWQEMVGLTADKAWVRIQEAASVSP